MRTAIFAFRSPPPCRRPKTFYLGATEEKVIPQNILQNRKSFLRSESHPTEQEDIPQNRKPFYRIESHSTEQDVIPQNRKSLHRTGSHSRGIKGRRCLSPRILESCGTVNCQAYRQRTLSLCDVDVPILFRTQSDDPISCYGKPVERTNEIVYSLISLVRACT